MTQDEKKAEEVLINFQKATQSWFRGESLDMDKRRETMINLLANALTEARQQVAKQKDERIAELEKRVKELEERVSIAEAREYQLRNNGELAYEEAKRTYPEYDWEKQTKTAQIAVWGLMDLISRIKAENERLKNLTHFGYSEVPELQARLSEALWALNSVKKRLEFLNKEEAKLYSKDNTTWIENAKSVLTNFDNARLFERERLKREVITYADTVRNDILIPETDDQFEMSCQSKEWVDGLLERLQALKAHENQNPRQG